MSLPDVKKARELLIRGRALEKERLRIQKETEESVRAWMKEEKAKKKRAALENTKKIKKLMDEAVKVAAEGALFMETSSDLDAESMERLQTNGFKLLSVKETYSEHAEREAYALAHVNRKVIGAEKYLQLIKGLKIDVQVWISVSTLFDSGDKVAQLMFEKLEIDAHCDDWDSAIEILSSWASLTADDQRCYLCDALPDRLCEKILKIFPDMHLNSARLAKLASVGKAALEIANQAKADAEKFNRRLRFISKIRGKISRLKPSSLLLLWDFPEKPDGRPNSKLNAMTLKWLASECGRKFLTKLYLSINTASRLGDSSIKIMPTEILGDGAPTLQEMCPVIHAAGFKARVSKSELEVIWEGSR